MNNHHGKSLKLLFKSYILKLITIWILNYHVHSAIRNILRKLSQGYLLCAVIAIVRIAYKLS